MLLKEGIDGRHHDVVLAVDDKRALTLKTLPSGSLYVFPGQEPDSLARDKAEVGGAKAASPYPAV
jgi:hypothetical protein